jgi:hypothetical protein
LKRLFIPAGWDVHRGEYGNDVQFAEKLSLTFETMNRLLIFAGWDVYRREYGTDVHPVPGK